MSLIQDALKRKTEEQHKQPPQQTAPSPAPSVEPAAPSNPANELPPPHSSERKLFLILVVAFILILLVIGISVYFVLNAPKQDLTAEPIAGTALPTAIIQPIEPPPVAVKAPEEQPKDSWPNLDFSGSASAGNQRLAIINGRMLSVGSSVLGVKVLEIGKTEVLVEYKGKKRVLRVGDE